MMKFRDELNWMQRFGSQALAKSRNQFVDFWDSFLW
jgi:hypothetical protein